MFYGVISIHALLAESDWYNLHTTRGLEISIHALLAESDATNAETAAKAAQFLSTLSLRRATTIHSPTHSQRYNFYPRSPCGERHRPCDYTSPLTYISIHALLAESDWCISRKTPVQAAFLSTLSLRRATISCAWSASKLGDFYPRSPCGERHNINNSVSTADKISIHALLAESDLKSPIKSHRQKHFYPRSPCGERLEKVNSMLTLIQFLSTLSLRRATAVGVIPVILII